MTTPSTPPTQPAGPGSLQTFRVRQHLSSLSILYAVFAALTLLFGCIGSLYMGGGGGVLLSQAEEIAGDPNGPPEWVVPLVGWGMVGAGVFLGAVQLATGSLAAMTARFIATRRHRIFCLVVAGLACLSVPLGTALGVYTFVILTRPEIIALFAGRGQPATGP